MGLKNVKHDRIGETVVTSQDDLKARSSPRLCITLCWGCTANGLLPTLRPDAARRLIIEHRTPAPEAEQREPLAGCGLGGRFQLGGEAWTERERGQADQTGADDQQCRGPGRSARGG